MLWLLKGAWMYRSEIVLLIQVLSKLRKSAREFTRDYIRKQMETRLKKQIGVVLGQVGCLVVSFWLTQAAPGLGSELIASTVLWMITVYNLNQLIFSTIPELKALHRALKGKLGYALKYFLEVSLVTELLRLNVLFLALSLALGISTRTVVGSAFSYFDPWVKLVDPQASRRNLK